MTISAGVQQKHIPSKRYPHIVISMIDFLGDEVQIEQAPGWDKAVDLSNPENAILSISKEQAVALAKAILEFAGE
ncbi:hypothetical protein D3C80_440200 [compost metagenome]